MVKHYSRQSGPSSGHHHQGCDVVVDVYGWVRVTWANCTTNGQNSTEDSLGWAESGTGGTSWSDQSNQKVNTNGIRTLSLIISIRANGFPRIATDRTCNSASGDDYVVMAEKNFAPALDNADIVLMKTPDGGSTWSRVRVNQNASGSYESTSPRLMLMRQVQLMYATTVREILLPMILPRSTCHAQQTVAQLGWM